MTHAVKPRLSAFWQTVLITVGVFVTSAVVLALIRSAAPTYMSWAYLWGIGATLVVWLVSSLQTNRVTPFALSCGVDDNFSASKFQFLIFTYVTLFAYVTVYVARWTLGERSLPGIPLNLLILMGLSVASATASKGIVVSYVEQGKVAEGSPDNSSLAKDKDGQPALTKVQMLVWTVVAAVTYIFSIFTFMYTRRYAQPEGTALPDIDGALLVLMGAAQGGYLGGKLFSTSTSANIPVIETITSPVSASRGDRVIMVGSLLGESTDRGVVIYSDDAGAKTGIVNATAASSWSDQQIEFALPAAMQTPGTYNLQVRVNGRTSAPKQLVVEA